MLPSQTARPSESRAHMYRRGKSRPWLAIVGGAGAIALVIVVIKWMGGGGGGDPSSADAGTTQLQASAGDSGASNGERTGGSAPAKPAPKQPESPAKSPQKEPVKIAMGGAVPTAGESAKPAGPAKKDPPPPTPPANQLPVLTNTTTANPGANPSANQPQKPASGDAGSRTPSNAPTPPSNIPAAAVSQRVQLGLDLLQQNKPVEARKMLSDALAAPGVTPAEADRIRTELTKVNDRLVFGPDLAAGDPFVTVHVIAAGDALAKLPRKLGLNIDWRFIQRVNRISDPSRIRAGQKLKIVKGPFHAVVDKPSFRLDLYMGDGSDRVYVRSFPVGLGEFGATPEGEYVVKAGSKLVDPAWTNPRTGEFFASKDPKNPLGSHWIGLVGVSDNIRGLEGYGVHGTIEPQTIGQEKSMGCVRMLDDDIALMYEVLVDNASHVEIRGQDWP